MFNKIDGSVLGFIIASVIGCVLASVLFVVLTVVGVRSHPLATFVACYALLVVLANLPICRSWVERNLA